MPPIYVRNWAEANAYCQGMPGWRLPAQMEVVNLVHSGAINGRGWFTPEYGQATWTSTTTIWNQVGQRLVNHITVGFQTAMVYGGSGDASEQGFTCVQAQGAVGEIPQVATAPAANNTPTVDQVHEAARSGHLDQAQHMMDQVLSAHPKSGTAHFVQAELYAKEGNVTAARSELRIAEGLDPGLPHIAPQSLQALKSELGLGR